MFDAGITDVGVIGQINVDYVSILI